MCLLAISSIGGGSFWQFFVFLFLLVVVVGGEFGCGGGCWPWRGGGKVGSGFFAFREQGFWVFLRGVHFVG